MFGFYYYICSTNNIYTSQKNAEMAGMNGYMAITVDGSLYSGKLSLNVWFISIHNTVSLYLYLRVSAEWLSSLKSCPTKILYWHIKHLYDVFVLHWPQCNYHYIYTSCANIQHPFLSLYNNIIKHLINSFVHSLNAPSTIMFIFRWVDFILT